MAGFSSYDDLIAEITAGKAKTFSFYKVSSAPEAAGVWHSLWSAAGIPGAGAAPATTPGTQYDDTAGSVFWQDEASDQKHIITLGAAANVNCTLMLYDRLVAVSGISLATTGAKTISSAALPRYSGAAALDIQAWLEVTTATTTTAPIVNLNAYTDNAGNTGNSGANLTFPAAATNVDAFIGPLPISNVDQGIRSIEAGLNVGTAGATGIVNVVLIKPLVYLPLIANQWNEKDLVLQMTSLPRLFDGASLAMAILASGTAATTVWGQIGIAWG